MKSTLYKLYFFSLGCFFAPTFLSADASKPLVVSSASMIADIASNIGGEHIQSDMIVPIGGDPHIYEPTPNDVQLVRKAQLILVNGLTFEGWITELIENSGSNAPTVLVTQGLEVLTSQQYKNSSDPHAWMTAHNGKIYALNIKNALQRIDPSHQEQYEQNYLAYIQQLDDLDLYIKERIGQIPPEKRILVTSHDAFQYYGKYYGLQLEAIMGISTEAEAQTADIIRVTRAIKDNKIPAIFIESTINPKLIQQIAKDNQVQIGGKLYADSLGDKDSPGDTYIHMLKYNTDTIVDALSQDQDTLSATHSEESSGKILYGTIAGFLLIALIIFIIKLNK